MLWLSWNIWTLQCFNSVSLTDPLLDYSIYKIFMSIRVSVSKFVTSVGICLKVQFDLTAKQVMCVKNLLMTIPSKWRNAWLTIVIRVQSTNETSEAADLKITLDLRALGTLHGWMAVTRSHWKISHGTSTATFSPIMSIILTWLLLLGASVELRSNTMERVMAAVHSFFSSKIDLVFQSWYFPFLVVSENNNSYGHHHK